MRYTLHRLWMAIVTSVLVLFCLMIGLLAMIWIPYRFPSLAEYSLWISAVCLFSIPIAPMLYRHFSEKFWWKRENMRQQKAFEDGLRLNWELQQMYEEHNRNETIRSLEANMRLHADKVKEMERKIKKEK